MEKFISEPLSGFLSAHTEINNYVKIASISIDHFSKSEEDEAILSDQINKLILESGERWTPRVFKNPQKELSRVKNDISKSGIIWVYSAFDVFYKQSEGIMSNNFVEIEQTEDEKENKIVSFYKKLNWSTSQIDLILPVFYFYKELRNCVAHNMGLPSKKIRSLSESEEFKSSIANWVTKFPKKTISAPPIVTDTEINLNPHHVVLYSETCRRIALDINRKMFNILGLKHFIDKTTKKHLIEPSTLTIPACKDFNRYISHHLFNDFNIKLEKYSTVSELLGETESEVLKERYTSLKSATNIN